MVTHVVVVLQRVPVRVAPPVRVDVIVAFDTIRFAVTMYRIKQKRVRQAIRTTQELQKR